VASTHKSWFPGLFIVVMALLRAASQTESTQLEQRDKVIVPSYVYCSIPILFPPLQKERQAGFMLTAEPT